MNNLRIAFIFLLNSIALGLLAQSSERTYVSHQIQKDRLIVQSNEGQLTLRSFPNAILEVSFEKNGFSNPDSSHAVVLQANERSFPHRDTGNELECTLENLLVRIRKKPMTLSFFYKNQPLLREEKGYFENDSLRGFTFALENGESLYGTGERALTLDLRGNRLELYNQQHYGYEDYAPKMHFNVPLVLSSKAYLLYFDNEQKAYLDLGKSQNNVLSFESIGGKMTYYLVTGDDFYALMKNYHSLTGFQPMPPRWIFGNYASRYGYRSEEEARNVIGLFEKQQIPVDAIILDHYWYGEGVPKKNVAMGDLDWYTTRWPNALQMIEDFRQKGVQVVLISQPFVLTDSRNFPPASENKLLALDQAGHTYVIKDFWFGETGLLDIFKPQTRQWLWGKYKKMIESGVKGLWGDLGEPEKHPTDIVHINGKGPQVRNIYGHYWAKTIFDNYQKDYPEVRPFILMRAGFAGSQRFGMIPWSGDVNRSWKAFKSQPSLAMNMTVSGLAYTHSDLGGFAGGDRILPELYLRWLQYGVFQPLFRPHSQEQVPSEPVFYPDSVQKIAKSLIEMRYRLLPYHYTMAFQTMHLGRPMMQPLFFEEPENLSLRNLSDSYLWGDQFLVAPVLEEGQKEKKLYLPKSSNWFDFKTDSLFRGGQSLTLKTSLDHIPVFVRGGAFVPMVPVFQNTQKYSSQKLQVHFYYDSSVSRSAYSMYEDDGNTAQAFEKNKFEILDFSAVNEANKLTLSFEKMGGSYEGMPQKRNMELILHHINKKPRKVILDKVNKAYYSVQWIEESKQFKINWFWNCETKAKIQLFL